MHYEQLIELSTVPLLLLLCSSLQKHTWVCSVAYPKGQLLIFSWEPVAAPCSLGSPANVFTNSFSPCRPLHCAPPFLCGTKALRCACVWSPGDAGAARSRLGLCSGLEDLWTLAISSLAPGPHVWERGRGWSRAGDSSPPSGRVHRPLPKGHGEPPSSGKTGQQSRNLRWALLPPRTAHAFRKGSFGKHLQTYGSFLSQDFFNSLCFLVFLEGGVWWGFFGGGCFVLFCLGGGGGCRLLLQKARLGKKTKRGGPSGGIRSTAKQLVPNSCPLQRD